VATVSIRVRVTHILRPTMLSIVVMLMALCFSLVVSTGRRATAPSAWEADLGAPMPFLAIAESRQGCEAPGPCGDLAVRAVSVTGLLTDLVVWYGAACLLGLALADAPDLHALTTTSPSKV
jgi:hypothetical protein